MVLSFRGKQLPGPGGCSVGHGDSRWRRRCCFCQGSHGPPAARGPRAELHPSRDGVCKLHWPEQAALSAKQRNSQFAPHPALFHSPSHSHPTSVLTLFCTTLTLTSYSSYSFHDTIFFFNVISEILSIGRTLGAP